MQTTLAQFNETQSQDAFALQNSKLLKVRLGTSGEIQAKAGSMVAYQGEVTFEHAGSGGLGRMMKKAMTGEGTTLMKMAGSGRGLPRRPGAGHPPDLPRERLHHGQRPEPARVRRRHRLGHQARPGGASAAMAGGLYNMELSGTGWVAILSDGPPVLLNVASAPTFADAQAAITWSSGVTTSIKTDFKMKNLIGKGSGESIQMAFSGQGWVLVQPSEGRIAAVGAGSEQRRRPREHPRATSGRRASDVDDVVVGGVVHDLLAARAPPARLDRGAAAVAQRLAGRRARPIGQQPQRAGQLAAALGQLVDEARRALGVGARDDQRLLAEQLQPRAEHVRRDPVELLLQLVEALLAAQQRGDQQQRPAVADAGERVGQRRGRRGARRRRPIAQSLAARAWYGCDLQVASD